MKIGRWALLVLSFAVDARSIEDEGLSGRYVLSQRTVVLAHIPILPDLSTETWSVSLVDLASGPARLHGRGQLCHIEMTSSSGLVRTELPAALKRLLSEVEVDARLFERAGGLSFYQAPRWLVLGAKLADPEHEVLPVHASDPRVIDQDQDGHPGVTVRVRGIVNGEVYVVQRGASSLEGEQDAFGFRGAVRFQSQDVVVGASKPVLTKRSKTRPDLSSSSFVLRKVGSGTSCEAAVSLARRVH